MAFEKNLKTRIVLTHDEYAHLKGKKLKEGEVVLAKVGTTEANGKVSEPIWMMKVGKGNDTTVENCPWLVAPAADVYEWAKKAKLDWKDVDPIPGDKLGITVTVVGNGNAVTDASWDATTKTLTLTKGETFLKASEFVDTTYEAGIKLDLDGTTFNHETTARNDTTDTANAEFGKTIEVIDSVTSDGTGHITAVNKKKITLPTPEEVSLPTVDDTEVAGQVVVEVDQTNGAIDVTRKAIEVVHADGQIYLTIDNKKIGTGFSDTDFIKDGMIKSVELQDSGDGYPEKDGPYLVFTWNIDNAISEDEGTAEDVLWVSVKDLVDVYTAGNGIEVENFVISHKKPTTVASDVTKKDRTYVTAITFDEFGHATGVETATETDPDYKDEFNAKADKVSDATSGNFAGLDANGNLTDSGKKATDFATADHNHDDKYAPIDIDTGVMSVKAKDEGAPSSSYASGIKVDNTDPKNPKIEIDDTIVFILDGGDASDLD